MSIYLDHNATTPLSKSVVGKLDDLYKAYYNPSSIYESGNYNILPENMEKAQKELDQLAEIEDMIDIHYIPLSELEKENMNLSLKQIRFLMFMIDQDVELDEPF